MSTELEELYGNIDFVNDTDRGAGILLEWLKNSPNVVGLVQAIMPEIQEVHDAGQDVFSTINIFEAVGTQLDNVFGEYLNTERNVSETDNDYRARLLAATSQLAKSGEIVVMKGVFRNLLGATSVSLFEYQPAAFRIEGIAPSVPSASQLITIRETLEGAKQGGNNLSLAITDSSTPFTFGLLTSQQLNSTEGFSGPVFTDGGTLSTGF